MMRYARLVHVKSISNDVHTNTDFEIVEKKIFRTTAYCACSKCVVKTFICRIYCFNPHLSWSCQNHAFLCFNGHDST